jgi:hypothetical protein
LRQWFIDSMALYEMANLPRIAITNIAVLLMIATGRLTAELGSRPKEVGNAVRIAVASLQRARRNKKRARPGT